MWAREGGSPAGAGSAPRRQRVPRNGVPSRRRWGWIIRERSAAQDSPVNTPGAHNGDATCAGRHNNRAERRKRAGFLGRSNAGKAYYGKSDDAAPQHGRAGSPVAGAAAKGHAGWGDGAAGGEAVSLPRRSTIAAPPTGSRGARFDQQRGRGAGFRASSHVCPRHIHSLRILVGDLKFENLRLLWWIPTRRCYPAALLGFWSVHSPLPVMLNLGTVGGGTGTVTEIGDGWGRSRSMLIAVFGGNTRFRGDGTGTACLGRRQRPQLGRYRCVTVGVTVRWPFWTLQLRSR